MTDEDTPAIRALDDRTVRQIAAGEVVERPASVVKELVENSLDAGASRVSVAVDTGGTEGVRVRDDGRGMTESEVELAVEEHTTSKIAGIDDLESGVGTLGFRGEALHTISAVSRTTVRTKPRGGDSGTELRVEGGEVTAVRPAGCPEGTVVEVEDLFYNTPARRKFLKTTATEFDHVNTVVTHYALANPDVAISLEHDDREVFATEGRGSLESTVLSVYGREVAESMVRVDHEPESGAIDAVSGLVSHPETTRSTREYLSTFVNGRYVTARVLRESVLAAYGGQLASDRYPFAVLFVDLPADTVDVNVHPRKMEVRFHEESAVEDAVEEAVRSALLEDGLVRASAPRGRSAPDETAVAPESPTEEVTGGAGHSPQPESSGGRASRSRKRSFGEGSGRSAPEGETEERGANAADDSAQTAFESVASDSGVGDDADADESGLTGTDSEDGGRTASADHTADETRSDDAWTVSTGSGSESDDATSRTEPASPGLSESSATGTNPSNADAPRAEKSPDSPSPASDRRRSGGPPLGVEGPTVQRDLDGEAAALEPEFDSLPSMRVLGQLHETYIVAETASGLVLVDQHAADERVNYERLRAELAGDVATQALANPVELELTAREAALFAEYRDALADVGFRAERTGERTVEVRSVPAVFASALDPELLRDALTAFVSEGDDGGRETVANVADELLADLACYPSVTGNTSLTEGSVVDLLSALDDCENPYACPHGRPVVIELDRGEIEDRFERDYPGHGGRRAE
ncbi:DNA mismatch repair protein MutL [Halopelagius inordinatus]|uniref:DNA mismatch repair protein MutL n=1 Tax=Halopelagius inordinatus TaxID=553467 RepID=A0A1I2M961_9EURY|nr:DNA mismatch repair endonuclease MutL [Halopelagius inordinatus]SFF88025.1 DNA mismatch repair protein MutL [Halopelagius inordinatus]